MTALRQKAHELIDKVPEERLTIVIETLAQNSISYNQETLSAIQEARDIISGKISAKRYKSFADVLADIEAEDTDA